MRSLQICLLVLVLCSALPTSAQSVLINEEWAKVDKSAEVFFNETTKQVVVLSKNNGFRRVTYNIKGQWKKPMISTRIPENLIEGFLAAGIDGDSVLFRRVEQAFRNQWYAYNLKTQMSRVSMRNLPEGTRSIDNFGAIYRGLNESRWHWESLRGDSSSSAEDKLLDGAVWSGYSGGKWLFVSQVPGDTLKTLNFFDSDGTVTPFPFPINRGKAIRKAHWINTDSLLVVEEGRKDLSIRLYALVSQKLVKGDASRLKVGSYSLLYETWEDTIPTIVLDTVNVVGELMERVIPNKTADRQVRTLGLGKFAARFRNFTDPNQAYSFLSRLVNVLPGSYAADIDTGIVILGPRRTTYGEVKADSALLATNASDMLPLGIIGFADQLKERNETVVSLYALDRVTLGTVPFQVSFFNRTQDQMIFLDSARSGQISFVYGHGDELGLTITARGYAPKSIRINSKTDSLPTLYHQDVLMDPLAPLVRGLDGELISSSVSPSMDFQNILFDFDSDVPLKVSQPELKAMADLIKRSRSPYVQIIGHTDDVGSNAYNKRLGQRRAEAVCESLVRFGVNPKILEPVSNGESTPLVPNDTDFNRSLNRRVELGKH